MVAQCAIASGTAQGCALYTSSPKPCRTAVAVLRWFEFSSSTALGHCFRVVPPPWCGTLVTPLQAWHGGTDAKCTCAAGGGRQRGVMKVQITDCEHQPSVAIDIEGLGL